MPPNAVFIIAFIVVGSSILTEVFCVDSTNYGRNNNNWTLNSSSWPRLGDQQPSSYSPYRSQWNSNFRSSTPWPALGSNRRSNQYSDILDSALPDPTWVRQRYNNANSYSSSYNNRPYSSNNNNNYYNNNYQPGSSSGGFVTSITNNNNNNRNRNTAEVTDDDLRQFSEDLLDKDTNNAGGYITVNFQGKTSSRSQVDEAPLPLITIDNPDVHNIPTISKLTRLHDNYVLQSNQEENYTPDERKEEDELLDAMLSTQVMQQTRNFLMQKGRIGNGPNEFKELLREIWFNHYARGGRKVGSSGFEHIFVAEIKNNQVSGLHNWVFFNEQEKNNEANYLGYMKKIDLDGKGYILRLHFKFHGLDKPVASMFVGTSPELEMALYSTCFLLRADRICPLKLNGNRFIIRTYTYRYGGKSLIGSAFPEI